LNNTNYFRRLLNWKNVTTVVLLVMLYFGVGILINTKLLSEYYQVNLFMIGINIILATSLNLINGFTGQFSIGHAGFMAVGAYVSAIWTVKLHYSFPVAILLGALATGLVGFLIGLPTLRLRGDYLAIATLGLGEIIKVVLLNIEYVGGATGIIGIPRLTTWTWLFILTVGTVLIIKNFVNSTYGRACISVRENEVAAEAMGINTTKYKVLAFTIGAFFAGVAGALFAHYFYLVQPMTFSFLKSFDVLVIVVLGGLGSLTGSVVAAVLLTVMSAALQNFPDIRMVLYALVLIFVMLYRPQGLLGTKEMTFNLFRKVRGDHGGPSRHQETV